MLGFKEKQAVSGTQFANAGIYMATKHILCTVSPDVQISLEKDLIPRWLAEGKYLRAFEYEGECVDIGTPERYQSAQVSLANVENGGIASKPRGQQA